MRVFHFLITLSLVAGFQTARAGNDSAEGKGTGGSSTQPQAFPWPQQGPNIDTKSCTSIKNDFNRTAWQAVSKAVPLCRDVLADVNLTNDNINPSGALGSEDQEKYLNFCYEKATCEKEVLASQESGKNGGKVDVDVSEMTADEIADDQKEREDKLGSYCKKWVRQASVPDFKEKLDKATTQKEKATEKVNDLQKQFADDRESDNKKRDDLLGKIAAKEAEIADQTAQWNKLNAQLKQGASELVRQLQVNAALQQNIVAKIQTINIAQIQANYEKIKASIEQECADKAEKTARAKYDSDLAAIQRGLPIKNGTSGALTSASSGGLTGDFQNNYNYLKTACIQQSAALTAAAQAYNDAQIAVANNQIELRNQQIKQADIMSQIRAREIEYKENQTLAQQQYQTKVVAAQNESRRLTQSMQQAEPLMQERERNDQQHLEVAKADLDRATVDYDSTKDILDRYKANGVEISKHDEIWKQHLEDVAAIRAGASGATDIKNSKATQINTVFDCGAEKTPTSPSELANEKAEKETAQPAKQAAVTKKAPVAPRKPAASVPKAATAPKAPAKTYPVEPGSNGLYGP